MAHIVIVFLALAALLTVLAIVFVAQNERPGLRRIGFVLLAAIGLTVWVVWDNAKRWTDEIDLCLDTTSGRYVGNDHPDCREAARRNGNPDRQFLEGGM